MLDIDKIAHAFDHSIKLDTATVMAVADRLADWSIQEHIPGNPQDWMFTAIKVCKAAPTQRADIIRRDIIMRLTQ